MTNESAILGLLAELYRDRATLLSENQQLRAESQRLEVLLEERQTDN